MYYVYNQEANGKVTRKETDSIANINIEFQNQLEKIYNEQQTQQPQRQRNNHRVIFIEEDESDEDAYDYDDNEDDEEERSMESYYYTPLISKIPEYTDTMSDEDVIKRLSQEKEDRYELVKLAHRIKPENKNEVNKFFQQSHGKSPIKAVLEHYREGMYRVIFALYKAGHKPNKEELKHVEKHLMKEISNLFNCKTSLKNMAPYTFLQQTALEKTAKAFLFEKSYDIGFDDSGNRTMMLREKKKRNSGETLSEKQKIDKTSMLNRLKNMHEKQKPPLTKEQKLELQKQKQQHKQQQNPNNNMAIVNNGVLALLEMIVAGKEDKDLLESPAIKKYTEQNNHTIVTALIRYDRPSMLNFLNNTYPNVITTNISIHDLENARSVEVLNAVLDILKRQNHFDINITDPKTGATALHRLVARNTDANLVKHFLENGANLNIRNKSGETVLYVASRLKYKELERVLIEHKQKNPAQPLSTLEAIEQSIKHDKEALAATIVDRDKLNTKIVQIEHKINESNVSLNNEKARLAAADAKKAALLLEEQVVLKKLEEIRKKKEALNSCTSSTALYTNQFKRIKITGNPDGEAIDNNVHKNDGSPSSNMR